MLVRMDDLGSPISFAVLEPGTPVLSQDGERIGKVKHVLADEATDIFEGVVISTRPGPRGHRYVDAEQIDAIHERAVLLKLDGRECDHLPEPSENPPVVRIDGSALDESLRDRLRRASRLISGG
jgi:uncharacterized protein YrrD